MDKNMRKKTIVVGVIVLFSCINITSSTSSGSFICDHNSNFSDIKTPEAEKTVPLTLIIYGDARRKPQTQQLSTQDINEITELFKELKTAITIYPFDRHTQQLKEEFITVLDQHRLIPSSMSPAQYSTLLNPPWLEKLRKNHNTATSSSQLISGGAGSAAALFCSLAGEGIGVLFPFVMLPRPRIITGWSALDGDTIVGKLLTIGGFTGSGAQFGVALGFWGIGLAYATPFGTYYGFIGYSLFAGVTAGSIDRYPPDYAPIILTTEPIDGAINVPESLSELRFSIEDPSGDLMSYTVTTFPDIGSGNGTLKPAGTYTIPVQNLEGLTEYKWTIRVRDDVQTTEGTFTFTTEAVSPIVSNPLPEDDEREVPMNLPQLQFTLKDYQGDEMEYTVETSPNIGSQHLTGIHDGTYTVPINGMVYGGAYHWYVNVTDGTHWTRKVFSFITGYPSPFDPFDYGWQYRKQIIIDHTKIPEDLASFPVLLSTADSDLTKAQIDGDDLLFMNNAGTSVKLYHEIESFNQGTGTLLVWVNVPSLSPNNDTVFYLYYGNPSSTNQEYPEKTWDTNFKAVFHMDDATPSTVVDSTTNDYLGIKVAPNGPQEENGKIGNSQRFDGTDDTIDIDSSIIGVGEKTISAWIKTETNNNWQEIFTNSEGPSSNDEGVGWAIIEGGTVMQLFLGNGGYSDHFLKVLVNIPDQINWHYYTMVYDGTMLRGYIDGVVAAYDDTKSGSEVAPDYNMRLGTTNHGLPYPLEASLDEFRISDTPRNSAWISTEYENYNNPTGFLSLGPEEPHP